MRMSSVLRCEFLGIPSRKATPMDGPCWWQRHPTFSTDLVHLAGRGVNFQPHPSQDEWAWIFESGPSTCTTPASSSGKGSEVGWVAPEYAEWATGKVTWSIPTVTSTAVALGKRHRDKRARVETSVGIPKGKWSVARDPPEAYGQDSRAREWLQLKVARRGAERPSPEYTGYLHQSLLRTRFQQGWGVEAADGQLTWVESTVQQQEEVTDKLFDIPRKFKAGAHHGSEADSAFKGSTDASPRTPLLSF
ncbi:hypothetical protein F5888DRAFT_1631232 [Russula emetica]|nr:hypothetical protein F5888DRAFT_1631232 [Russula emetica]